MPEVIAKRLLYGAGSCVAIALVWVFAVPAFHPSGFSETGESGDLQSSDLCAGSPGEGVGESGRLQVPPCVCDARAIAIAYHEPTADGRMRAIVRESLKADAGTELEVGEERPGASLSPGGASIGEGRIVFVEPGAARATTEYAIHDGRILALGNLSVDSFRKLCAEDE